jgi:hypothetical protein
LLPLLFHQLLLSLRLLLLRLRTHRRNRHKEGPCNGRSQQELHCLRPGHGFAASLTV